MQEIQQVSTPGLGWKLSNILEPQRSVIVAQTHFEALPHCWYADYCSESDKTLRPEA